MGVRGLSTYIKTYFPMLRTVLDWRQCAGQTWGIDCSPLLFRAKADNLSPLTVIARLIVTMRAHRIRPIFVFDGRPPDAKQTVIQHRRIQRDRAKRDMESLQLRLESMDPTSLEYALLETEIAEIQRGIPEISSYTKNEIKDFLYAVGVLSLQANGEADDVLAHLARNDDIQGIVTTDMDLLVRGHMASVIIPETSDATVMTAISPVQMANAFGISLYDLPIAGVLMGCDYTSVDYFRTLEPGYVLTLFREQRIPPFTIEMKEAVLILRGEHAMVQWTILLSEKQQLKWATGDPPKEPDNIYRILQENRWPRSWLQFLR
jgi:hypothetical protein